MARRWSAVTTLLAALGVASPAVADWLVTRDGARVETKGPWTVKGNQILFRQPNGTLSALRTGEVDLDASRAATARAVEEALRPAPTPEPRRAPVLRLTERDLPPVDDEETAGEASGEKPKADTPRGEPLAVSSWDSVNLSDGSGIEIFGTLTNQGGALVTAATVAVSLFDADGGVLVTESANVATPAIPPGASSTFRVQFPGLMSFATAKFAVASQGYRTLEPAPQSGLPTPPPPGEAAPPDGDDT